MRQLYSSLIFANVRVFSVVDPETPERAIWSWIRLDDDGVITRGPQAWLERDEAIADATGALQTAALAGKIRGYVFVIEDSLRQALRVLSGGS